MLERTAAGKSTIVASAEISYKDAVTLQVDAKGDDYGFNYSVDGVN